MRNTQIKKNTKFFEEVSIIGLQKWERYTT